MTPEGRARIAAGVRERYRTDPQYRAKSAASARAGWVKRRSLAEEAKARIPTRGSHADMTPQGRAEMMSRHRVSQEMAGKLVARADGIEAGTVHVVLDIHFPRVRSELPDGSWQDADPSRWSVCSCGLRFEGDESDEAMAARFNKHAFEMRMTVRAVRARDRSASRR